METHRRRQTILGLLRQAGELDVDEAAVRLGVSPNTIRNDFNALAAEGLLQRVHGGATLLETAPNGHSVSSPAFERRRMINREAKSRLARWAAGQVDDGDSILLDASTSAYAMVEVLQERHNLTVITNGVEAGRALAQNTSNKVLLLGGLLRADGVPVTGLVSEQFLGDLHIRTAFVSCAGFTPDAGLTEADIQEAELKSKMIAAAGTVVALIDASKFGKVDLAPFARADQVTRIVTDSALDTAWIEPVQKICAALTVCGESRVVEYAGCPQTARRYRIGFSNLSEQIPFAVEVRRGLEQAARSTGGIDLVLTDNQLSRQGALRAAGQLIDERVDLAIEYQIDAGAADLIMPRFRRANIPVIAVDIPMVGATFFGVDNYQAGYLAGAGLGRWINAHWGGECDRLVVLDEPRAGSLPAARIRGQRDGLEEAIGEIAGARVTSLNSGNRTEISQASMEQALDMIPQAERLAVICFNDDAALGAIAAARKLGRERGVAVAGQGADRRARDELRRRGSPLIGSTAYYPEEYGQRLLALAAKILRGEPVPPAVYIEPIFITLENVDRYYPDE